MSLDKSISTHFKEKILKTNFTTTHGRNVRASCEITVEKPIIHSRTQYDRGDVLNYESMKCDEVKVGDYLEGEIRQGFFKWPYIVNKSL